MYRFAILLAASVAVTGATQAAPDEPASADPVISISELAPDRFELVYTGTKFTSRDEVEAKLLLSSARLALAHGAQWFVLLALPGELPDVHPPRRDASFGPRYGHWEPHWNYYLPGTGWQPWHPEWGAEFWTKEVDPKSVSRFEAHAMIDLGPAPSGGEAQLFNASDVVRDLGSPRRLVRPLDVPHRP